MASYDEGLLERLRALHDELTELPNRQFFKEQLGHSLGHAHRLGQKVAVQLGIGPLFQLAWRVGQWTLILLFAAWQPITGTVWDFTGTALALPMWLLFGAGWLIVDPIAAARASRNARYGTEDAPGGGALRAARAVPATRAR